MRYSFKSWEDAQKLSLEKKTSEMRVKMYTYPKKKKTL